MTLTMFALAHSVSAKPLMEYYSGDIQFTLPPPVLSAGPGTEIDVHFCEEIFKHRKLKMLEEDYLEIVMNSPRFRRYHTSGYITEAVELMTPSRWSVGGRVQMPPGFYVQEVNFNQNEASFPVGVVCTYYPFK